MSPRGAQSADGPGQGASRKRKPWLKKLARTGLRTRLLGCLALVLALGLGVGAIYLLVLSHEISKTFEGRLWSSPSRVYSAPMVLHAGQSGSAAMVQSRLERCNYTRVSGPPRSPGQYRFTGRAIVAILRLLPMPGGHWPRR